MARVVAEMYRIENVIYVRIKPVAEQRIGGITGQLLCYRPKPRAPLRVDEDALALGSIDPQEHR